MSRPLGIRKRDGDHFVVLQSNLLYIHVSAALFSYAACAIAFITAVLFLIKDKLTLSSFGIVTSAIVTSVYLLLDKLSVVTRATYHVVGWDFSTNQKIHVAEKTPLSLEVPGLGSLLLVAFFISVASLVLYILARSKNSSPFQSWAYKVLLTSTAFQLCL